MFDIFWCPLMVIRMRRWKGEVLNYRYTFRVPLCRKACMVADLVIHSYLSAANYRGIEMNKFVRRFDFFESGMIKKCLGRRMDCFLRWSCLGNTFGRLSHCCVHLLMTYSRGTVDCRFKTGIEGDLRSIRLSPRPVGEHVVFAGHAKEGHLLTGNLWEEFSWLNVWV